MLKTSEWAFSISSSSSTEYGLPAHRLGELAGLLVADVAGRGADQPRDGVALLELAHVEADHRVLVAEQRLGERAGELGLADAGRARGRGSEPTGRLGSPKPGAGAAHRARRRPATASSWPTTRSCSCASSAQQPLALLLRELGDRDAGAPRDDLGDVLGASPRARAGAAVGAALVELLAQLLESRLELVRRARSPRPATAWSRSRSSARAARSSSARRSGGLVFVRSRTRAAAWSIRSIALSGRKRSRDVAVRQLGSRDDRLVA